VSALFFCVVLSCVSTDLTSSLWKRRLLRPGLRWGYNTIKTDVKAISCKRDG
jgi:hypothetical protein